MSQSVSKLEAMEFTEVDGRESRSHGQKRSQYKSRRWVHSQQPLFIDYQL